MISVVQCLGEREKRLAQLSSATALLYIYIRKRRDKTWRVNRLDGGGRESLTIFSRFWGRSTPGMLRVAELYTPIVSQMEEALMQAPCT